MEVKNLTQLMIIVITILLLLLFYFILLSLQLLLLLLYMCRQHTDSTSRASGGSLYLTIHASKPCQ